MKDNEKLSFLLQAASWQESLLQSYRLLHLITQFILLIVGFGFFAIIAYANSNILIVSCLILFVLTWESQVTIKRNFSQIILARQKDVDYWHREIIMAEHNSDLKQRPFTKFKVLQKQNLQDTFHLQEVFLSSPNIINNNDIDLLIEKGVGHARKIIDNMFIVRLSWLWVLLFTMSVILGLMKVIKL